MKGRAQDRVDEYPEDYWGPLGSKLRRKRLQRNSNLKLNYGITLRCYEKMLEAQGGCCDICRQPETGTHNRGEVPVAMTLSVDHDHETGAVRALLCSKCNKALGLFNDNPTLVREALEYLLAHSTGG